MKHARLSEAWQEVVPEEFRAFARLGGYKNKVLTINVRSSAALQELAQFWREPLRRSMIEKLGGEYLRDIRFVLADFRRDDGKG